MTRKKGDVFGTLDRVKVGSKDVDLQLDSCKRKTSRSAVHLDDGGGMPRDIPEPGGLGVNLSWS